MMELRRVPRETIPLRVWLNPLNYEPELKNSVAAMPRNSAIPIPMSTQVFFDPIRLLHLLPV